MPTAQVTAITMDVAELTRAIGFWTGLLGIEMIRRAGAYAWLEEIAPGVSLVLQEVADPKVAKNRVHLDLWGNDVEALLDVVEALGGRKVKDIEEPDYALAVMADPDGNEFCVSRRLSPSLAATSRMP